MSQKLAHSNFIECLRERGLVDALTSPELVEKAARPLKVYIGFDPTAESLHLGNLVGIIVLAWAQKFGHTPVVVLGGATGRIGDPSGKSVERPLLEDEMLEHNVRSLRVFFERIFPVGPKPMIVNNNDWFARVSFIEFLRDVGKHFRVGPMLAKEMVRSRIDSEEGISYTEFSYQILQGYDFHYLAKHHGVTVQMGGSDQWGNITAGIEFHRKLGGDPIYGLTFPLLTRSDGKKFGKTEGGAVWLSAAKLTPFQFYQYLFSIPDADVIRLLKMLTFVPLAEIDAIERAMQQSGYRANDAQRRLAEEVTRFVHGEEGLQAALKVTEGIGQGSERLSGAMLEELKKDMPHASLQRSEALGRKLIDLGVQLGMFSSKGEGVRMIQNGGVYLNRARIEDPTLILDASHLIEGKFLLLSIGKKKQLLVTFH